jgi:hypothetical protein
MAEFRQMGQQGQCRRAMKKKLHNLVLEFKMQWKIYQNTLVTLWFLCCAVFHDLRVFNIYKESISIA